MKSNKLKFVKDTLLEMDPSLRDTEPDDSYDTALVLLSALAKGTDSSRLAAFTGLPLEFVAAIRQRMIRAELWTEVAVCCDHWEVAQGVVSTSAFWSDVLVAEGCVVRRWDEDSGEYRYWAVDYASHMSRR